MSNILKSVMPSNTQINKLLQISAVTDARSIDLPGQIEESKTRLGRYYELFVLMTISGCRITEALNIRCEHITESGRVLILGLKNSDNRLLDISILYSFFTKHKTKNIAPFHSMNRFTAYRYCKELGIGKLKKGRIHESITHAFRDSYLKDIKSANTSKHDIARSIGHKSIKSQEYYGKD